MSSPLLAVEGKSMRLAALLASPLLRFSVAGSGARLSCVASNGGIADALATIRTRLNEVASSSGRDAVPRLVAVSKTKPVGLLQEAYDAGHRDFGENYVQELVEKAPLLPSDIRWRFIGNLQSNKAKLLVHRVPNLVAVETVASIKLADKLNSAAASTEIPRQEKLGVFIQVNTSPWEGTKNGILAEETPALARHIVDNCGSLRLEGLMTIGAPGDESCFQALRGCRDAVASHLSVDSDSLELSMGMSGDFEAATRAGSSSVRVGSSIFGARDYPAKAPSVN